MDDEKRKLQMFLSLFLIALFPLTTTLSFQAIVCQSNILFPNITTSGVGNFIEDFTTDVFKDPATNFPWWAYVIIGGGLVLIVVVVVSVVLIRKRKAIPAR